MKPVQDMNSFGQRIRRRRVAMGISQRELAEMEGLKTTYGMIGRYERDEVRPTLDVLQALSKALNTSVAFLVGECNYQPDSMMAKIALELDTLPLKEQDELLQRISKLISSTKFHLLTNKEGSL